LVELRHEGGNLAFRAPGFLRSGEVDDASLARAMDALGVGEEQVVRAGWIDNGPGWLGLQLVTAEAVLALEPDFTRMRGLELGVIGPHDEDTREAIGAHYEVRAFCPAYAVPEDPVTGSLNAGFALWLIPEGHVPPGYVARQGTAVGRDGRVTVSVDDAGDIWVGGPCHTLVDGSLTL
jgi:PhzF family phenazine biosynthesis protein